MAESPGLGFIFAQYLHFFSIIPPMSNIFHSNFVVKTVTVQIISTEPVKFDNHLCIRFEIPFVYNLNVTSFYRRLYRRISKLSKTDLFPVNFLYIISIRV